MKKTIIDKNYEKKSRDMLISPRFHFNVGAMPEKKANLTLNWGRRGDRSVAELLGLVSITFSS